MATERCPACWADDQPWPYRHDEKTSAIPKRKDVLMAAILAHPQNIRAERDLQPLMVQELKLMYKQTLNLVPHPRNPTLQLGGFTGFSKV